jgi:hypothetical protein
MLRMCDYDGAPASTDDTLHEFLGALQAIPRRREYKYH